MIWLFVGLVAISVSLFVLGLARLVTDPEARLVRRRLHAVPVAAGRAPAVRETRRRTVQREKLEAYLEAFGRRVGGQRARRKGVKDMLVHAGYRRPNAGVVYMGARVALAASGLTAGVLVASFLGAPAGLRLLLLALGGLLGWMLPFVVVRRRMRRRQDEVRRTLPDALDLMVVSVEAGLGLNQALVRVGEEMERVSSAVSEEFTLVSLEMRAGVPREEALRNLGERTGIADVRAFVAMLVQTDRFGTSIADALRIHADELRTKRRQVAEERAAKLAVKLLIPILLFIFPSMFIVMLAPALFHITEALGGLGGP
jgi:tight adherence protein C